MSHDRHPTIHVATPPGRGREYVSWDLPLADGLGQGEFIVQGGLGRHQAELWLDSACRAVYEFVVDAETAIHTGDAAWDSLYPLLRAFVDNDIEACFTDGRLAQSAAPPSRSSLLTASWW